MGGPLVSFHLFLDVEGEDGGCMRGMWANCVSAYKFPKAQERLEELKRGGSKVQMKRERLSRTNQKQQEENCSVM
jgi:hypothetical protein